MRGLLHTRMELMLVEQVESLQKENDSLKTQRNELLAALEACVEIGWSSENEAYTEERRAVARKINAAIAKVKGGAA